MISNKRGLEREHEHELCLYFSYLLALGMKKRKEGLLKEVTTQELVAKTMEAVVDIAIGSSVASRKRRKYDLQRYYTRKKAGVCTACGQHPATQGTTRCTRCWATRYQRQKKMETPNER